MRKPIKKLSKKAIICIVAGAVMVTGFSVIGYMRFKTTKEAGPAVVESEVVVERRDILNTISGTSTVEPKDSYEIRSLVSGEIIYADFEKGDTVNKDDILYRVDSSDTEKNVVNAENSLKRAEKSYSDAVEAVDDLTVMADYSGKIRVINVEEGDSVSNQSVIAEIYDDTNLEVTVPFVEDDANQIFLGQSATVTVMNNGAVLYGAVTHVMDKAYTNSSRMILRDVTVRVKNPGALTPSDRATVEINKMYCNDAGQFKYITETTQKSSASGTIKELYVKEGDYVRQGQKIALIENKSVTDAVSNAELSLSDARLNYENAQNRVEDYTIKAPISGTVVEKDVKMGDKLDSSNMTGAMAIIYDMSALTFDLAVDETDISKVSVGQSVVITADAIENKTYMGTVTNVSIVGATNYGITTYPVTVEITEFDDTLMPGMNIEAIINVSSSKNVLTVPISAINRDGTVYVKGNKESKQDHAPDGFKTVKVEIGDSDGVYVEIKSGINEGDIVKVMNIISTKQESEEMHDMLGEMHSNMPGMGGNPMNGGGGMPDMGPGMR